jgi:hypothetical protein
MSVYCQKKHLGYVPFIYYMHIIHYIKCKQNTNNIIILWNYYDKGTVNGFDNNLQN